MRRIGIGSFLPLAVVALTICLGCKGSTTPPDMAIRAPAADHHDADHEHADHHDADHDHADHEGHEHADDDQPKTYAEAIAKVEALETQMREALEKGDKEAADEALHEIGHVLEHVETLARDASFSDARTDEVKKDVDELFDHFGTLDEQIHGDEEVKYDELSEKIHAAVERLHQQAAP